MEFVRTRVILVGRIVLRQRVRKQAEEYATPVRRRSDRVRRGLLLGPLGVKRRIVEAVARPGADHEPGGEKEPAAEFAAGRGSWLIGRWMIGRRHQATHDRAGGFVDQA